VTRQGGEVDEEEVMMMMMMVDFGSGFWDKLKFQVGDFDG